MAAAAEQRSPGRAQRRSQHAGSDQEGPQYALRCVTASSALHRPAPGPSIRFPPRAIFYLPTRNCPPEHRPSMLARVLSGAVLGIDTYLVGVETDVASGLPSFSTVGLAQGAVKEGRERVIAAIQNSGYAVPPRRITVNLAPAGATKERSFLGGPASVIIAKRPPAQHRRFPDTPAQPFAPQLRGAHAAPGPGGLSDYDCGFYGLPLHVQDAARGAADAAVH